MTAYMNLKSYKINHKNSLNDFKNFKFKNINVLTI